MEGFRRDERNKGRQGEQFMDAIAAWVLEASASSEDEWALDDFVAARLFESLANSPPGPLVPTTRLSRFPDAGR